MKGLTADTIVHTLQHCEGVYKGFDEFDQDSDFSFGRQFAFKWVAILLMLPTLIILFWNKHLRMHPFNLVAYLILTDTIQIYYLLMT